MFRLISFAALILAVLAARSAFAAEEWGLPNEKVVRFEAKVVDILCELTGDCPTNCGGGRRQLGLIDGDGTLRLAHKNFTPFAGAAAELIDFCGKRVIVDGLFTTNRGYTLFALQYVREAPKGKWRRANRFLPKWAKEFGFAADGPEVKRWFRNDPRVQRLIETEGKLGLGLEADAKFLEQ